MEESMIYSVHVRNQYGLSIGSSSNKDLNTAKSEAMKFARITLRKSNPNWKWRIAKTTVTKYE